MNGTDGRLVVKGFPAELHRELRMASAADEIQMREIVIDAVRAELQRRRQARRLRGTGVAR